MSNNNFLGKSSTFGNNNNGRTSSFNKMDTKVLLVLIAILIIFVIFSGFMGYIFFQNYSTNKIQDYMEVELLGNLHSCDNNPLVIEPAKIPASTIGNEYSLNFWIYVSDLKHFNKNPNNLGNVLIRGLDNGNQGKYFFYEGNPGIYMKTGKNNLVFSFKPEENIDLNEGPSDSGVSKELLNLRATLANTTILQEQDNNKNNLQPYKDNLKNKIKKLRTEVETKYISGGSNTVVLNNLPLQRWTCINVSLFNQNVDLYVDGKLKTSKLLPKPPTPVNTVPMILAPNGGFDGYLSRIKFSNNTLHPSDIYERYSEGPRITKSIGEMFKDVFSKN